MTDKKPSEITVSPQSGMIHNMVVRAKLLLRLIADSRVSLLAKVVPIGALIYVASPIDLLMGVPGVDAVDDLAVAGLAYYFFIEMCPPDVVQEHLNAIEGVKDDKSASTDDVVDGEVTDIK
jgi:uncharacterized membrane protein YkvA (DUF1232 family)